MSIKHKIRRARINPVQVEADNGDLHLVLKTWTASARSNFRWIPTSNFNGLLRRAILLELERSSVWCICNPEYDHQVYAWICADPHRRLVHYVFTKQPYRNLGFARLLVDRVREETTGKLTASNATDDARRYLADYFDRFDVGVFDPQPKREQEHEPKDISQTSATDPRPAVQEQDDWYEH